MGIHIVKGANGTLQRGVKEDDAISRHCKGVVKHDGLKINGIITFI